MGWAEAAADQRKHGITFEHAITAFDDPYALFAPDPRHSTAIEERRWLIGEADMGVVVVVFTLREEGDVYRIISARPASRKERRAMSKAKEFPFESARRVTTKETATARRAIERRLGKKRPPRRGRPPKGAQKYLPVSIRLNPKVVTWAKKEAQRRGIGYQTVINEVLLAACA